MPKRERGFTIIEVIIVVLVLAILAAILIPNFRGIREDAKVTEVSADLRTLQTAVESYVAKYNCPPTALADLLAVSVEDRVINKVPKDPFSANQATDYQYARDDGEDAVNYTTDDYYVIWSKGTDGLDDIVVAALADGEIDVSSEAGGDVEAGGDIFVTNAKVVP